MSDNTKALRCADALDALRSDNTAEALADQAAAELRRLHALNAELAEPQRKPLTDEQVRDLWSWSMTPEAERTATTQQHAFARAIEKAHGITGGSDGS